MANWKHPLLLITGIGVSYLGNWIYLIALNLAILNLTGSAAAVAGLFIIRPIAVLLTNTWSGSIIDRVNKRRLMIAVDILRGIFIFVIPFVSSLWGIYALMLITNIAGAFFGPSSSVYITKLVPSKNRKRFNSIMSMTSSSAFLIGPAIAGVLIMKFSTDLCIFINAITFFICAGLIALLPNIDEDNKVTKESIKLKTIILDWKEVKQFASNTRFFVYIYILFQAVTLIGFALDSQEVTFIKQHLLLSDQDYGLIVSITGIGSLAGAFIATLIAKKISLRLFISGGMLLTALGYFLFYTSINFITATLAFVFLGFFMAFANSGYATFFQNNVPIEIMGRVGSVAEMVQGIIQISLTLILGVLADLFNLQIVCLIFAFISILLALILCYKVNSKSKEKYFNEAA